MTCSSQAVLQHSETLTACGLCGCCELMLSHSIITCLGNFLLILKSHRGMSYINYHTSVSLASFAVPFVS